MELLIVTIAILIVLYIGFVLFFPKAIPEELSEHTKNTLNQIYQQQIQAEDAGASANIDLDFEQESAAVKLFYQLPLVSSLYPLLLQAGMKDNAGFYIMLYVFLALLTLLGMLSLGHGMFGVILFLILPYFLIKKHLTRSVRKRNIAFINAFPEVLDIFVRSIRSGFPVTSAMRMIAENMDPPVSTEFQRIVQELAMGQSLNACLTRLANRINEPDIRFFVVVLKVQQETGGNLAEVVGNLSNIIRKRKQLRLKIRALTSEGKATSYILGALPLLVFGAITVTSPNYMDIMWTDPMGMVWLGIAGSLIVGCMLLVNKMIALDV
jgi:tight adherence protein B